MKIAIIGLGRIGRAIAEDLNCDVEGWDVNWSMCSFQVPDIKQCLINSNAIFVCVPSDHFNDVISLLKDNEQYIDKNTPIITFTKGLCNGRLPIHALKDGLQRDNVGVISGPTLSEELTKYPSCAEFAYINIPVERITDICDSFKTVELTISTDVIGVSLGGILKNIYAVGMGILTGLGVGDNTKAAFATKAYVEMVDALIHTGAYCHLNYGDLGDFLATCYSSKSRNTTFGYKWAMGEDVGGLMSEGIKNIHHITKFTRCDMPVAQSIIKTLESKNPRTLLSENFRKYKSKTLTIS